MDRDSDANLFRLLSSAIDEALERTKFGSYAADFVISAAELDPRLYDAKLITHLGIRRLWEYSDEYFDSWAHGFPGVWQMNWEEARQLLETMRSDLRKEFAFS